MLCEVNRYIKSCLRYCSLHFTNLIHYLTSFVNRLTDAHTIAVINVLLTTTVKSARLAKVFMNSSELPFPGH